MRLGPYEIVDLLGAGGMGEVYRARDTRLDRTVALKTLAQKIATNTQARDRFEREARAISALSHPNICALFDVGTHDGTEYLVMELLDGESLAQRLSKGPMSPDQAARIGACIADALARAHLSGIVHRDLKPGNIMLTKSGPKLLDFGLARKAAEETNHDATTMIEKAITADGTILGTLPYMAPEQLEGRAADERTDIFALGAVLYEMVTGRRAFNATSQASLISKIMTEQPKPIAELQPVVPSGFRRIVMKCMAKDPDERWQCAADVASELRVLDQQTDAAIATGRKAQSKGAWIAAALCAAIAIVLAMLLLRRPATAPHTLRFSIAPPPHSNLLFGVSVSSLDVSPDGTKVVFLLRDRNNARLIWTCDLARGTSKPLDVPASSQSPFWSPDSRSVAFVSDSKLKRISIDEGTPQTICDVSNVGVRAAWLPDGTILFSQDLSSDGVMAVPATGGTARKVAHVPDAIDTRAPCAIGATRHFFFLAIEKNNKGSIWIGSLDGANPRRILADAGTPHYDAPFLTFVREGTIFVQRFNERKLELEGTAVPLADTVWYYAPNGTAHYSVGGDTLVWVGSQQSTSLTWIDRNGHALGEALPANSFTQGRISPDGRHYLCSIVNTRTLIGDIYMADLTRKSLPRLTFGDHDHTRPLWSRDGRSIAFGASLDGPPSIFIQPLSGGEERAITKPSRIQRPEDWLIDGRILFTTDQPKTGSDLFIANPDGSTQPWLQTPAVENGARISPDQRWVAYVSDDSGRFEVYVAPLDHHTDRVRVSTEGGNSAQWSRDGRELYFISGGDVFSASMKGSGDAIDFDAPQHVYSADQDIFSVDTAPDGRLLIAVRQIAPATQPLNVMVGWKEEAMRLLARK